ncbi:MAG: hypothetical protein WBA97_30465 [Actinophytocola sp.]
MHASRVMAAVSAVALLPIAAGIAAAAQKTPDGPSGTTFFGLNGERVL